VPEDQTDRHAEVDKQQNGDLRSYRQIASDVSHDLNNILLLISGYSDLLAKNLDDRNQVISNVQNIQAATSKLKELSKKLQAMAHVENAETKSESVPDKGSDIPSSIRPGDINVVVFVFDGELKQLVSRILEREGFSVGTIVVNSIGISTNRDSRESVDLIVADVDIFKVARVRVRQLLRKYPQVPLLLLTNEGDEIPTIAAAGGSSSLSKAFRPSELVAEVNRILVQRDSREPNLSRDL
jgi:signal transduction histidine kinase